MQNITRAIKSRYIRSRDWSWVQIPLTPALSLRKREFPCAALECSYDLRFADRLAAILPLPKGEGWGEGEERVRSCWRMGVEKCV